MLKLTNNSFLPSWFLIVWILVAFVGFMDSVYLTVNHFTQGMTPCSIIDGCEVVTSSVYSTVFGVPIALFGVIFYGLVLLALFYFIDQKDELALVFVSYLSFPAFVCSLVLLLIQAFIIKAFCLYCLLSIVTTSIIFILGVFYLIFRLK